MLAIHPSCIVDVSKRVTGEKWSKSTKIARLISDMEHVSGRTIIGSCVPLARASSGGMHINSSTDPHRSPERHANTIGNAKCPCIGRSEGVGSSVIILDSSSQAVRSECVVSEIPASGRVDFHGPKAATGSLLPSA